MLVDPHVGAVDRLPEIVPASPSELLKPYVPRLSVDWLRSTPEAMFREIEGSLAFVDISGFTKLTERLARKGKVGAEEMSDTLNATFAALLDVAYQDGASLVKWGGDAVLLLFDGADHAARACRAAYRMRATMRDVGQLQTSAGRVTLRMSVGIHSGIFHFFLVGDPTYHRELIVSGPAASTTAVMEATADAGEIGISPQTAAQLDPRYVGKQKGPSFLLRAEPDTPAIGVPPVKDVHDIDLATMLPVAIREHLLAQPGEAEHRTIAVGFVQFSGTDALLQSDGPQALADALHEAIANVQQATASHGVTFFETDINQDGGKVMLTAGAPLSHGREEDRMLRAARLIVERAGTLPLRMGINRGPVFSGDFGPFFRRTYSVKGDAINLAARVMGKAQPGQLLATRAVVDRVTSQFELTPLPPFMVKGKALPVECAVIGPLLTAQIPQPADAAHTAGPLVGREAEMAVLTQALAEARDRHGRLVELVGEPGIGKSRLVAELRSTAGDVDVLLAASEEYESATPYFPFRTLLRDVLGLPPGISPEAAYERLQGRVAVNAPDLLPWLPLVGVPLDLPFPATPETERLDARFRKTRVEEVTTRVLDLLLSTPTLIVLDDVHLMDDASADLVRQLVADVQRRPWLVLTTRRDNQPAGYAAEPGQAIEVRPGPLDDGAALALVTAQTGAAPLPPHEMAILARRAGGNPLFLQGLVLAAQQTGSIQGLPDSVEALITAQIDRLPPSERTVLRYASVLGVTFRAELLDSMLADEQVAADKVMLARLSAFLLPDGKDRYRFQHALIRDAAYEALPYRRRQLLHGRVGETVEAASMSPDDHAELLSLHFFHADRMDKAWHYSRVAGERATAKFAYVEAAELLARAMSAARRVPSLPATELATVEEALGDARFRVGVLPEARAAFRSARALVQPDLLRTADLMRKEAEVAQRLNQLPQALRTLTRALRLLDGPAGEVPEVIAERSRLQGFYAVVRQNQGHYRDSIAWGRRAEADAVAASDKRALAEAYDVLYGSSAMLGIDLDRPYGELALELYAELGDRAAQSQVLNNLAVIAGLGGHGPEALDMFRRAEAAAAEAGDTVGAAATRVNVGDMLLRQGRLSEAEPLLRTLLPVLRGLALDDFHAAATRTLGLVLIQSGRIDEGRAMLDAARAALAAAGQSGEVVETDAAIAQALLESGSPAAAADLALDAAQRADALGAGYLFPTLHRVRGAALADSHRPEEALVALEEALRACETQGGELERGFVLAEQSRVAASLGDAVTAARLATESAQALDALGFVGSPRYSRD